MCILILGANGQVGWELQRSLAPIGEVIACNRQAADFEKPESLRSVVSHYAPKVIVNAAAYTAVDQAEVDSNKAKLVNSDAVSVLAEEAKATDAWLVHYSTDYVFDGTKPGEYEENDITNPLNVYGSTKLSGEESIREIDCDHFIFRTSWVYADRGNNFIKTILRLARERDELSVVSDQIGAPTHAELIADVTAHALHQVFSGQQAERSTKKGTYHLTASGETSWYEYACYVLSTAERVGASLNLKSLNVSPISSEAYQVAAVRPKNSRLNCSKLGNTFDLRMPAWQRQVERAVEFIIEQMT